MYQDSSPRSLGPCICFECDFFWGNNLWSKNQDSRSTLWRKSDIDYTIFFRQLAAVLECSDWGSVFDSPIERIQPAY